MCGLVGYITTEVKDLSKKGDFLKDALHADALRGEDSTGMAAGDFVYAGKVRCFDEPTIFKKSVSGPDFVGMPQFIRLMNLRPQWVLGHNRKATNGVIASYTAHPFHHKHILLAHNGHVLKYQLPKYINDHIDSEAIAYSMAEAGELETLRKLSGGYALTWINFEDNTFNVARNDAKILYWSFLEKENSMIWASELPMMWWLAERNGLKIDEQSKYPRPHTWYKFSLDDLRNVKPTGYEEAKEEKRPFPKQQMGGTHTTSSTTGGTALTTDLQNPAAPKSKSQQKKEAKLISHSGLELGSTIEVLPSGFFTGSTTATTGNMVCDLVDSKLKRYFRNAVAGNVSRVLWANLSAIPHSRRAVLLKVKFPIRDKNKTIWSIFGELDKDQVFPGSTQPMFPAESVTDMVPGPGGILISKGHFLSIIAGGCDGCGAPFYPTDYKDIEFRALTGDKQRPNETLYACFCSRCSIFPSAVDKKVQELLQDLAI